MLERLRPFTRLGGIAWLVCIGAIVAMGCRSSPFLAAQFATHLTTGGTIAPSQPATSTSPSTDTTISTVCDLTSALRNFQVTLINQSSQEVHFALEFMVTAGTGGFVECEDERNRYANAGYTPCTGTTCPLSVVGCAQFLPPQGTQWLHKDFNDSTSGFLPQKAPGATTDPSIQLVASNGSSNIPVPQFIILGNGSTNFVGQCTTTNDQRICQQRGFIYTAPASGGSLLVGAATAQRTQGTPCNEGLGLFPQWSLDLTPFNSTANVFEYEPGGIVIITVLDRATDTGAGNQVVWQVTDSVGNVIHAPSP
ncbi:MAG TPA: hypothetical protein VMV81_08555 [Phycisphaerae bacterium]|nr:hypothetical protein [Phycisphaerae bacterium]